MMGFAPEPRGETIVLRACPLVTDDRAPHPLVCVMHEGYLNEVYGRTGPEPSPADETGARTRLTVVPLTEDGCHVDVEPPAPPARERGAAGPYATTRRPMAPFSMSAKVWGTNA